ncbi:MAG: AAA family ATPase [Roseivivax sp.]|nr:AAA family ATPase [Roseivivax sp.]
MSMETLDTAGLADRLRALPGRAMVAIAGAPGSGKSTTAETLAEAIGPDAQVIPMDGFHRENDWLDARGLRARKGAPETFDAEGFVAFIQGVRDGSVTRYPTFDRSADCTRPGAGTILPQTRLLLVEGNYLLLDRPVWRDLAPLWDMTVWIDVPIEVLRARLVQRWLHYGKTPEAAAAQAEGNDLANARTIIAESRPADVRLTQG